VVSRRLSLAGIPSSRGFLVVDIAFHQPKQGGIGKLLIGQAMDRARVLRNLPHDFLVAVSDNDRIAIETDIAAM
jgi:hypothetical protein